MSAKVKVVVNIWAKPGSIAAVEGIVRELCAASRKEVGCISYTVLCNTGAAANFVLYEEWESAAHLDAHNRTAHFAKAVGAAQEHLAKPLEVGRYSTLM